MGYWDDDDWGSWRYRPTKRREAKGGIKAKSRRGKIGESWWSGRFINILESFDIGTRLSRGRSYARTGQVMGIEIVSGLVTAKVQGSRPKPYKVRIELEPLKDQDWSRVEKSMAEQAIFMAKLLAGEMPHEIEEAFTACKLSLFPASRKDMETECSCPDFSNPCKHIAAVYYILAEKFDEDPFLIFAWRGRTKEQLIGQLRALRGTAAAKEGSSFQFDPLVPAEDVAPLADCLSDFWRIGPQLSEIHIRPKAADLPDALLRQLGPLESADLLETYYEIMTAAAERKALK
jgi:uncharacterized Zn finger protein